VSLHQKAGLVVDKILHECVFAKTLDNITAVMIAFDNFEKNASDVNMEARDALFVNRRSLEPVQEEYIESEQHSPGEFVDATKDKMLSRFSPTDKLSKTQPISNIKNEPSFASGTLN